MLMMILWREFTFLFANNFSSAAKATVNARVVRLFSRFKHLIESGVIALSYPIGIFVESHVCFAFQGEAGLDHGFDSRFYRDANQPIPAPGL